ncbi:MAG: formate/nitrite transporter family protein, partial [Pirellulaceae bacterium]
RLPTRRLFFSGVSAGLEIGFSLFLMATVKSLVEGQLSRPVVALLVANMYSFGFLLVILGRSKLFTEQTSLAVLPVLYGKSNLRSLARLWTTVFCANVVGGAGSAALMVYVGPRLGVIQGHVFEELASTMVHHSPLVIVLSGILAGWLMGLLSWLVAAGRDTISQIVIVWLVTAVIGLGHLHHSVLGTVEVLAGVFWSDETTWSEFFHFLLWTTIGNAIGGPVFLAVLKSAHVSPSPSEDDS